MNEEVARKALELVAVIEERREKQKPLLRALKMWAELALQGYTHAMVDRFGQDPERVMRLIKAHDRAVRAEARRLAKESGVCHGSQHIRQAKENIPRPAWMDAGGRRPQVYTKVLVDGAWEELETPVEIP